MELAWGDISEPVMRNMDIELLPFHITGMTESKRNISISAGKFDLIENILFSRWRYQMDCWRRLHARILARIL